MRQGFPALSILVGLVGLVCLVSLSGCAGPPRGGDDLCGLTIASEGGRDSVVNANAAVLYDSRRHGARMDHVGHFLRVHRCRRARLEIWTATPSFLDRVLDLMRTEGISWTMLGSPGDPTDGVPGEAKKK